MSEPATWYEDIAEALPEWIGRQRWYVGKQHAPTMRRLGALRLHDPRGHVGIGVWYLRDEADPAGSIYQVPLTFRSERLDVPAVAEVAQLQHAGRSVWIYDGCYDPAFTELLLRGILRGLHTSSDKEDRAVELRGHPLGQPPTLRMDASRVLTGEQSNTSIIYQTHRPDGTPCR